MARYLLTVYGLFAGWLWWLASSRGTTRVVVGVALLGSTLGLFAVVRLRSRRLHSDWESVSSRAITHAGGVMSRWDRRGSSRRHDPADSEAHVGGWL
jgi:hypothetical protein